VYEISPWNNLTNRHFNERSQNVSDYITAICMLSTPYSELHGWNEKKRSLKVSQKGRTGILDNLHFHSPRMEPLHDVRRFSNHRMCWSRGRGVGTPRCYRVRRDGRTSRKNYIMDDPGRPHCEGVDEDELVVWTNLPGGSSGTKKPERSYLLLTLMHCVVRFMAQLTWIFFHSHSIYLTAM
jgi:hypothetical protein